MRRRGRELDPFRAATIGALAELGYPGRRIMEMTDTPRSSVYDILNGKAGYVKEPVLTQLRKDVKERLQARSLDLSDRALNQVELALPESGARDAAVVYGILRDHERLDAGEATANVEIHVKQEFDDLEALGDKLAKSLLKQSKGLDS